MTDVLEPRITDTLHKIITSEAGDEQAAKEAREMFQVIVTWVRVERMTSRSAGRAEGFADGQIQSLLRVLALRGVAVDKAALQRIASCRDQDTLVRWLDRAVTATRLSEVLEDLPQ